jgi:2-amino-4-hydroxy-6-hydroxymethyldihydropteridine diphosphokinase
MVYLGLGANLGDRAQNLAVGVALLVRREAIALRRVSSLYDSAPFGPAQGRYLNAVVEATTPHSPRELLDAVKAVERELGRLPGPRWGPRTLDVDLLFSDGVVAEPDLQIPHLLLHTRAFALLPLCELLPEAVHPVLGVPLRSLLDSLPDQDVHHVGPFGVGL